MGFQYEGMGLANLKTPKRIQRFYGGRMGIMEKKMETTILYKVI